LNNKKVRENNNLDVPRHIRLGEIGGIRVRFAFRLFGTAT